ncbi:MAG: hypothetical protein A2148_03985 [Chloroflexi bacterium RBG_16_68_14]|nr:MAG: hypothetical protein A2148_03985 [Chloroflexi bacterium RBG_16_68_14]
MEPRIQYAKTADGVSIAFWTLGEGLPLVFLPMAPWSHIQREWEEPLGRAIYDRLLGATKLVRYDSRGSGLSERDIKEFSLDALLLDLEAVVDRLNLERFALWAAHHSGPVALAYAVRHPDRVSHLVMRSSYARASDYQGSPQHEAMVGILDKDWGLFTETAARVLFGWSDEERSRQVAAFFRECVTQETAQAFYAAVSEFDVSDLLAQVKAPTLVVHVRAYRYPDMEVARKLAAALGDARLVVVPDLDALASAVLEFLGEGAKAAATEPPEAGAFRTVLFTDVAGSTSLTQRLGDARAREVLRTHETIVREALRAHGGSEVKTMGDGFMASFSLATRALECAVAMQRAFAEQNETAAEPVRVRIGLNAGEPIVEEEDLFGTAVIVAHRIATKAAGGEILASDVVRQLVAGKGFLFSDRGDVALRGFEDPVRVYEVRWREA